MSLLVKKIAYLHKVKVSTLKCALSVSGGLLKFQCCIKSAIVFY